MSRCKDHRHSRVLLQYFRECIEKHWLFALDGAARNNDWLRAAIGEALAHPMHDLRICGGVHFELQVPADAHTVHGCPDFDQASRIFFALREEDTSGLEYAPKDAAEPPISRKRP